MDNKKLYIPKTIKVGYQKREGTYTGKLAYVIYYDDKGKLRKEQSWNGWRHRDIEPEEFENKPQSGICLNKDVQRYNWSHFGSGRSYIRIYDPRGIEFEISPENLIGILTETDCLKRGLEGEFVYAWHGKELVLLPCCSQAYKEAKDYTALQSKKISLRDIKEGCSYTTKKGEEVIYMGRFNWFEPYDGYSAQNVKMFQKVHVFYHPSAEGRRWDPKFKKKTSGSFLAECNNEDPVLNYAELVEEWNNCNNAIDFASFKTRKRLITEDDIFKDVTHRYRSYGSDNITETVTRDLTDDLFCKKMDSDTVGFYSVHRDGHGFGEQRYFIARTAVLNMKTNDLKVEPISGSRMYSHNYRRGAIVKDHIFEDQVIRFFEDDTVDIQVVLGSGNKRDFNRVMKEMRGY